jgi:hypothetical protein
LYHINWSTNSSFTVTTLLNGKHIWRILDFISMCIFSSFVIVLSKDHCNSQFKHLISTDCTGSCKSHYHTITTMTVSKNCQWHHLLKFCFKSSSILCNRYYTLHFLSECLCQCRKVRGHVFACYVYLFCLFLRFFY